MTCFLHSPRCSNLSAHGRPLQVQTFSPAHGASGLQPKLHRHLDGNSNCVQGLHASLPVQVPSRWGHSLKSNEGTPHLQQHSTLEPYINATHLEQLVVRQTNNNLINLSYRTCRQFGETQNSQNEKSSVRGLR